jgi:hypothetical protein
VLTVTFSGTSVEGGSLEDGRYNLSYFGDSLRTGGSSGQHDETKYLWRLFGDMKGMANVDSDDKAAFMKALGSRKGQSNYVSYFDYDSNGLINNADLTAFNLRYLTTI